jgi:hypothetical protein
MMSGDMDLAIEGSCRCILVFIVVHDQLVVCSHRRCRLHGDC